jgi:hypothetical protein
MAPTDPSSPSFSAFASSSHGVSDGMPADGSDSSRPATSRDAGDERFPDGRPTRASPRPLTAQPAFVPLQTSLEGLRTFAEQAFHARAQGDKTDLYHLYNTAGAVMRDEPERRLRSTGFGDYLRKLGAIDLASRKQGVFSRPQFDKHTPTAEVVDTPNPDATLKKNLHKSFFRAMTSEMQSGGDYAARVTLRLKPQHIPEVWHAVSTELLPAMRDELPEAKVAGPVAANNRTESALAMGRVPGVQEQVKSKLERFGPAPFRPGAPYGMQEIAKGISWTEEDPSLDFSHGQVAVKIIETAMQGLDEELERQEAAGGPMMSYDEALRRLKDDFLPPAIAACGRDPRAPHLLLRA